MKVIADSTAKPTSPASSGALELSFSKVSIQCQALAPEYGV